MSAPDAATVLAAPVHAGGAAKRFGDLGLEEVKSRAGELREAVGWGPTTRVGPVARAWAELARHMEAEGAQRVADLDPAAVAQRAQALWVVPPGGSLL